MTPSGTEDSAETTSEIRVLLVDDEWLVRAGMRTMLTGSDGITIVGEAPDGSEVVDLINETHATLVLMDLRMPNVDGLTATAQVRALPNPPDVVVLTTFDADDLVLRALRAGASGFLLKDTPPADLVAALRQVAQGEPWLSPSITRKLIHQVTEPLPRSTAAEATLTQLSQAEQRVAIAVARGLSNAQIAADLYLSVATVKSHISHILDKLGFNNRVQVALLVHDAGLLDT